MEGSDIRFNIKRKGHRYTSITPRRLYRDSYIEIHKRQRWMRCEVPWDKKNTILESIDKITYKQFFHVQIHLLIPQTHQPPIITLWCPYTQLTNWSLTILNTQRLSTSRTKIKSHNQQFWIFSRHINNYWWPHSDSSR